MITTTQGHLTATNKKHINIMFKLKLTSARINRIEYHIALIDAVYDCNITKLDRGLGGIGNPLQLSTYKVKFKYS